MIDHLLKWERWNLYNHNNQYNFKLFFAEEIENIKRNQFYFDPETHIIKPPINIVSRLVRTNSLSEADYIFVPHPWVSIRNNYKYKNYLINLSNKTPLLISNTDDTSPRCDLPNTLEFRTFLHPRESKYRKIIVPYPAKIKQFKLRPWKPIPTISFMGYVPKLSFGSLTSQSMSFFHSPIKSSVYLNRKISIKRLESLAGEFKIICIERQTFTLLQKNINLSTHMDEYEKNLLESDYILCPRGFANTSIRFYEALSSGATPILIKSINLTAVNPGGGKVIGVIEVSARLVKDISSDIVKIDIEKESSSSAEDILPVGFVSANSINLELVKYNQSTMQTVPYNCTAR
jgi:hypothetical protein